MIVAEVVDAMGFDTMDAGALAEGIRFEAGTSAFGATASGWNSWRCSKPMAVRRSCEAA